MRPNTQTLLALLLVADQRADLAAATELDVLLAQGYIQIDDRGRSKLTDAGIELLGVLIWVADANTCRNARNRQAEKAPAPVPAGERRRLAVSDPITVSRHPHVPCGYLITRQFMTESMICTIDHQFPQLARDCGWDMTQTTTAGYEGCQHSGTDGSIDCPECGTPASGFIAAARKYLDRGPYTCENNGYFG